MLGETTLDRTFAAVCLLGAPLSCVERGGHLAVAEEAGYAARYANTRERERERGRMKFNLGTTSPATGERVLNSGQLKSIKRGNA